MVDQILVNKLKKWQDNPSDEDNLDVNFSNEYITTLFTLYKQLSEEYDDKMDKVKDAEICMQFVMTWVDKEFKFWISTRDGKIDFGPGEVSNFTVTLRGTAPIIYSMLSGDVDPRGLYMSGELTVEGNLQDALLFNEIMYKAAALIETF